MISGLLKLRIETPIGLTPPGRGFYQLEEDALYVQVGASDPRRRFFSFLESEHVRFDLDKQGRLMFIEISLPRRQWQVTESLTLPRVAEPADVRWLDFRDHIPEPTIRTDSRRSWVLLKFADGDSRRCFMVAESVMIQIDDRSYLTAVWITDIDDDMAGQQIAAFRKQTTSTLV